MKRTCEVCAGPVRGNNRYGVCTRNPECDREHQRRWREANPDYGHRWFTANWRRYALYGAKSRAAEQGVPFSLTEDELPPVPATCPVLGIPLARSPKKGSRTGPSRGSPSLDRIVPELGYVAGNIQWLSSKANTMKHNASPGELRRFAEWVLAPDLDQLRAENARLAAQLAAAGDKVPDTLSRTGESDA